MNHILKLYPIFISYHVGIYFFSLCGGRYSCLIDKQYMTKNRQKYDKIICHKYVQVITQIRSGIHSEGGREKERERESGGERVRQTQSDILYVLNNAQLMHSFPFRNPEA